MVILHAIPSRHERRHLLRRRRASSTRDNASLLLTDAHSFILPSIVVTELWAGKDASVVQIPAIEDFMQTLLLFPLDIPLAKSAGILRREHKLELGDAIIAATAIALNATLLTRNVRDFKKIPGLKIRAV